MIVKLLPEMTLAFLFTEDPQAGSETMNAFLTSIGSIPEATKKYFFRIEVSAGSKKKVTHALYRVVPAGTKGQGKITIIQLPSGEYLQFSISKRDFEDTNAEADKKIGEAAKEWLAQNNRKFDMRSIFGLIEEDFVDGYEMYNIYFPIK